MVSVRTYWLVAVGLSVALLAGCGESAEARRGDGRRAVPVEVVQVERRDFEVRRSFPASLEPASRMVVATLTGGRVAELTVDIGDRVARGQIVARLDRREYVQAVREAEANVAVAEANRSEAVVQAEIAGRELARAESLRQGGAIGDSALDASLATARQRQAGEEVATARVAQAQAALSSARARLDEAEIAARWVGGEDHRLVSERFVDEGSFVSANTPLLAIVEVDTLRAVLFATERDHARLRPGLPVTLTTQAWPGEVFQAEVARVAPVFSADSRQARVELAVPNADGRLTAGLFVEANVVTDVVPDAVVVPVDALVTRGGQSGVFTVSEDGVASLRPVVVGARDGDRVQVTGEGVEGRVVVLGQQLLSEGTLVSAAER